MPRIDPQQLLTCLKPLLAPQGGIKSQAEVQRIASLMEKYSKKLVSKCIYIQILKNTGAELLDQFMSLGGWSLVHQWLNDGNESKNWPFVIEILEMFLLCPVDSARLKSNKTPIIVKYLANNSPNTTVSLLATKLADQWLKIARQEQQKLQENKPPQNGLNGVVGSNNHFVNNKVIIKKDSDVKQATEEVKYKISNKDTNGKLLLSLKRSTSPSSEVTDAKIAKIELKDELNSEIKEDSSSSEKKSKSKDDKKDKKSSSSHTSSHKSSSKSSHKERSSSHKSSGSTSSSSSKDKHHKSSSSKSSSSSSSRDKSKDKEKERERRKKEEKEKAEKAQAEKDKETLNFLQPLPSAKLQKIPKRQHSDSSGSKSPDSAPSKPPSEPIEKKKPSMSIEVRTGDKPKTVKTLNSQFRDHGLAAEAPKPPSRKDIKKPGSTPSLIIASAFAPQNNKPVTTATSPTAAPISPPPSLKKIQLEKALESEVPERVGGVKLIKPKPQLIESIGFMDALAASAVNSKKDGKKRKRLPSNSSSKKDEPESPKVENKPLKFYKDTMEDEENRTNGDSSPTKELDLSAATNNDDVEMQENSVKSNSGIASPEKEDAKSPKEEIEVPDVVRPPGVGCGPDGPPCVLVNPLVPRRKKRSLRWRDTDSDKELTEVRLFELDENERANVTRTFSEQIQAEHGSERDAFQRGRSMQNNDYMPEQTPWRRLIPIDIPNPSTVVPGCNSTESAIQAERERSVLQDIFFQGQSMNDSPTEPDHEPYDHVEALIIPPENESNPEQISTFNEWPAPKGDALSSISLGNAFGNVFGGISSNINIPPNLGLIQNPLNLNMGLNFGGILRAAPPVAPFVHQPPPNMLPVGPVMDGSNRGNFNNYNRSNINNNNNHRNTSNSAGGSWVRGNATKRGSCHMFRRTGQCRNLKCPYVHER